MTPDNNDLNLDLSQVKNHNDYLDLWKIGDKSAFGSEQGAWAREA